MLRGLIELCLDSVGFERKAHIMSIHVSIYIVIQAATDKGRLTKQDLKTSVT